MSELFEFTSDFSKYAGMTAEEMERAIAEDRRRAIEADPRTVAATRAAEQRGTEAKAEQQRQADEARRQQQADAAAELEEEKQRRLRIWELNGGAESEFETQWPAMKRRIVAARTEAAEREREAFTV